MTESEAKQSVVALVQLMGWTIDFSGHRVSAANGQLLGGKNGPLNFPIKLNSPTKVCMTDDWVKDVKLITYPGYGMFCFYTWLSALNALCSYDRNEQPAHRP